MTIRARVGLALALSVALTAAPLAGVVPAARADAAPGDWNSLQAAFDSGGTQTVTLAADITADVGERLYLRPGDVFVLDLGGHSLTVGTSAMPTADNLAAIAVPSGAALTIRDSAVAGVLNVRGGASAAGIGGDNTFDAGSITISSGTVTAVGGLRGSGIGGGSKGSIDSLLIEGGHVVATGGGIYAAGLGGGHNGGGSGQITIAGGTVEATGASSAAGIGGGNLGDGITTTITGGKTTARGGSYSAGIGGGRWGEGKTVTITGGSVTARSGSNAAGIGAGYRDGGSGPLPAPGVIKVTGTEFAGSATNGGTPDAGWASGRGAPIVGVAGSRSFFATVERPSTNRVIFTIDVGWVVNFSTAFGIQPVPQIVNNDGFVTRPADPARPGYGVWAWHRGSATGPIWDFATHSPTSDTTLFVEWVPLHPIVVEPSAHGLGTASTYEAIIDTRVTLRAMPDSGYRFDSWVTSPSGLVIDSGGEFTMPDESVTVEAVFVPVEYAITYGLAGGSGSNSNAYTIESPAFTLSAPSRAGYVFVGWSGTDIDGMVGTLSIPLGSTGDRSYTAHWEADTPLNSVLPQVTGGTVFGASLTATPGDWSLGGLDYSYQWLRDGAAISSADGQSYQLTADDLGTVISVVVTAERAGDARYFPGTAESAGFAIPLLGTLSPVPTPVITGAVSGNAPVGGPLTVDAGAWGPDPVVLSYHWLLDGAPIPGATNAGYTPVAADLDGELAVAVTGAKQYYAAETRTSAVVTVTAGTMALPAPTVAGTAETDGLLSASAASAPVADSYAFQWLRDGVVIAGASGVDYSVVAEDAGHELSVEVTAQRAGYTDAVATSAPVEVGFASFVLDTAPVIYGSLESGGTLTATAGAWSPTPTALSYVWLRDGVTVASGSRYVLGDEDAGSVIAVVATAAAPGYARYTIRAASVRIAGEPATGEPGGGTPDSAESPDNADSPDSAQGSDAEPAAGDPKATPEETPSAADEANPAAAPPAADEGDSSLLLIVPAAVILLLILGGGAVLLRQRSRRLG